MWPNCRFKLRPAGNADTDAIWALVAGVLDEYGIVADRDTTDQDLADIDQHYHQAGGAFLVLLDGDRLVGCVALARESAAACELCRMYLAADCRGQGLGRRLLQIALQQAAEQGFSEVRLETAAVLKEAIGLYRSAGFTMTDVTPKGKNCNLVMVKYLAEQPP